MKFSPDGKYFAYKDQSGSLCVLSFDSGKSVSVSFPEAGLEGKSDLT